MKKCAIIPARSGSKGLPDKNVLLVNGKPLLAYTVEAALQSKQFEQVIVSTDSQEYLDLLADYPIKGTLRASHLSGDTASTFVVVEDVLQQCAGEKWDYFALLQPTSPLRTAEHIQAACVQFEQHKEADFLVSLTQSDKSVDLIKPLTANNSLAAFDLDFSNYTRQQQAAAYYPNGAIFLAKPEAYLRQKHFFGDKSIAFVMDKADSLDIDDRLDFEYFCFRMQLQNKLATTHANIHQRIECKKSNFSRSADITLMGHSILDQWNIKQINDKTVNNLAISGISAAEYWHWIVEQNLLHHIGKYAVLMFGANDIVRPDYTVEQTTKMVQRIVTHIQNNYPHTEIYFLSATPTAFRPERPNACLQELNAYLQYHLHNVHWLDTFPLFANQYGKLKLSLSSDGLHLNENGYEQLASLLKKELVL